MPMSEKGPAQIPYFADESAMFRMERLNRRLIWAVAAVSALLILSNAAWALHVL